MRPPKSFAELTIYGQRTRLVKENDPQKYETWKAQRRERYRRNKEYEYQRNRRWWVANKEYMQTYRRNYYTVNREKEQANNALWRRNNPILWALIQKTSGHNRRAKLRGAHTHKEWSSLVKTTGYKCLACWCGGNENTLHRDHIVSLAHGGANTIDNIQPLCASCNHRKRSRSIDYRLDRFPEAK